MKIGEFFKELRLSKKLNQEDLSLLANVNKSKISRMEKYNQMISCDEACRLCEALKITPNAMWNKIKNDYTKIKIPEFGEEGREEKAE